MGKSVAVWKRVVAYVLDSIAMSIVIVTPLTMSFEKSVEDLSFSEVFSYLFSSKDFMLALVIVTMLTLFYWTFLEWKFNQTLGKIIMNISVESVDKKPLKFSQAVVRNLTKLSTFVLIIDTIYMFYKNGDQRYFEELSKTHIIEEQK